MTDEALRSIMPLSKESLRGIQPAPDIGIVPVVEWINPKEIFVEENYQRDLSENSISLIRRIVANFNWTKYKLPICVRVKALDNLIVCIDGQHTAIGAASHPAIDKIPVVIVEAQTMAERAIAFVGHNRDRLALTQMAIFYGELIAGDPDAQIIDRACKRAGARILNKAINLRQKMEPGVTIAVGTIRNIAKRHGEDVLTDCLRLLTEADRGPINADELSAVALIFTRHPGINSAALRRVIASKSAEQWGALAAVEAAKASGRGRLASFCLASLWTRELGIRLQPAQKTPPKAAAGPTRAPGAAQETQAKSVTDRPQAPSIPPAPSRAPAPRPTPAVRPQPRPAPRPARPAPPPPPRPIPRPSSAPAPAVARPEPAPVSAVVRCGEIEVDTGLGLARHRGHQAEIPTDAARLLALLAKVRPAFLESADLMQKLGLDAYRLQLAAKGANRSLSAIGLEIKNVMKTGWMVAQTD